MVETFNDSPVAVSGRSRAREIAGRVLRAEGRRNARLRIIYTGDRGIRKLHRDYLGKDRVTDVITFPIEWDPRGKRANIIEAEIYVNVQQAARQAAAFGATRRSEIDRLIIHGVLHLTGHDDGTRALRAAMSSVEDRYLAKFGPGKKPATKRTKHH